MLKIVDSIAVDGVYAFRETYGVPVEIIAEQLLGYGIKIGWDAYIVSALAAGMKPSKIQAEIVATVVDLYKCPEDYATAATQKLIDAELAKQPTL